MGRNSRRTFSIGEKNGTMFLSWDFSKPEIKWFEGAKLNITENCIDRHLATKGNKTAIFLSQMILKKMLNILLITNCMKECASLQMF